jgi:3-methyladenine DNA glycosylase AlkC
MAEQAAPALKEIFDAARFRSVAREVAGIYPAFDGKHFLELTLPDLEPLSLLQRLRLMTEGLHATLPADYATALEILRSLAPHVGHGFVAVMLCDYVGQYGHGHFDLSMDALKFLTRFGSAEFAIREFLRDDLLRTLGIMKTWALDPDEHVRRLASEGCRPRLPWSFRLDALIVDPSPTWPLLESLRRDPSLYVRKSVANHINDITKDHPDWVLDRLEAWAMEDARTVWITRQALRTLIKKGNRRALALLGAGEPARIEVVKFAVQPTRVVLGGRATLALEIRSISDHAQRLVIDYAIHYVKSSGKTSQKVFKWKEITLGPRAALTVTKSQIFRDFTTRVHHAGRHAIDILINGERVATEAFELVRD